MQYPPEVGSVSGYGEGAVTTKADVTRSWGGPDDMQRNQYGQEIWAYKNGLAWLGIVPILGVGIPLALPIGNDYTYITFAHGRVQSCRAEYTSWSSVACSLYTVPGQDGYCAALKD